MKAYRMEIYLKSNLMFIASCFLSIVVGLGLRISWEFDNLTKRQIIKNIIIAFCVSYFAYHVKVDYPKKFDWVSYQLWLGACSFFSAFIVVTIDKMVKTGGVRLYLKNSLKKFLADDNV